MVNHTTAEYSYQYEQRYFDSAIWGEAPDYLREVVADILAVLPDDAARILDVGCGDGFITDRLPADREVLGVDLSPVALAHVKRPTQIADATALPFADLSFDLVMANDVVEHFDTTPRERALAEISRVAGKYVIITTPFAEWLARGRRLIDGQLLHVNRHCASFDLSIMKALLPSFRLVRAVFSGVEWEDETAPVEMLLSEIRGGNATLDTALARARREQAKLFCDAPEQIDAHQRRTEIIGLYVRDDGMEPKWPRTWAPGAALNYDDALADGTPLDRLSIAGGRFTALARADLPTVSPTPYICADSGVAITPHGADLEPGQALRLGFFAPVDHDAKLLFGFSGLEHTAVARVLVYENGDYRLLADLQVAVDGTTTSIPLAAVPPSEYGYLFHLTVDTAMRLESAAIVQARASTAKAAPGHARYLVRQAAGVELAISLRGSERRIPDWFAHAEHYPAREDELDQRPHTVKQLAAPLLAVESRQRVLEMQFVRDRMKIDALEKRLQSLGETIEAQVDDLSNHSLNVARLTYELKMSNDRLESLEQSTFHLRKLMDRARLALRPTVQGLRAFRARRSGRSEILGSKDSTGRLEAVKPSFEPPPAPRATPKYGELPRTVTMLVPDDRIDRRVLLEARTLTRAGAKVLVVAAPYPDPVDLDRLQFPEIDIVRIDTMRPPEFRRDVSLTRLGRFAFDWEQVYFYTYQFLNAALLRPADLIVAHDLPVLPAAIAAADMMGSRLVYDAHELYPEQQYFGTERIDLYRRVETLLAPLTDAVLTVNKSIAEEMAQRYAIPEPTVIINAPDTSALTLPLARSKKLREAFGLGDNVKLFLYQGGLSLNRNLEALAVALAYVRDPDVVLVFMGPGDEKRRELEALASEHNLVGKRVFFHPAVPQDVLLSYTVSADVGIIPYPGIDVNTTLCTPNKMFEFLVAGLPILANDLPELRRYVVEQGAGITHSMTSPQAIAEGIDRMASMDLTRYLAGAQAAAPRMVWAAQEPMFLDVCLRAMAPR